MTNLNHLLNQLLTSQNKLKEKQVTATDGDGVVTAVVTCNKQLVDLHADEDDDIQQLKMLIPKPSS